MDLSHRIYSLFDRIYDSCSTMESYFIWAIVLGIAIILLKLIQFCQNQCFQNELGDNDEASNDANQKLNTIPGLLAEKHAHASFRTFQIKFTIIFLAAMFADWMTGAFLYKLYEAYLGVNSPQISVLYMIGFASSALVSTFIGSVADKFGRKKLCLLFCITYAICALVKHDNNYKALMVARFLGGLSTSILFSCFESWMISEHHNLGFDSNLLGSTFQLVWGLNSIVAIIAGPTSQMANNLYKHYNIEPPAIGPFDVSAFTLGLTFIMILVLWKNENYGNSEIKIWKSLQNTMTFLFKSDDYNVLKVGYFSALFEGAMYLFVFKWNPTLMASDKQQLDEGWIFTVFMMSCLTGTVLNGCLQNLKAEAICAVFCLIAGTVMIVQKYVYGNYEFNLCGFIIFEICVGIYFPIIGRLRERYIPDHVRATVMNLFRIPLNLVVILGLLFDRIMGKNMFVLLGALLFMASGCAMSLCFAGNQKIIEQAETECDTKTVMDV